MYSESSSVNLNIVLLVAPLEAGAFSVAGPNLAQIWQFPSRAAFDLGMLTSATSVPLAPAKTLFPAGTVFAIEFNTNFKSDGTPVTNTPLVTLTFTQ